MLRKEALELKDVIKWLSPSTYVEQVPGGSTVLPDPKNPGEMGMGQRETNLEELEMQKQQAFAAMANLGLSQEQTIAVAGQMINQGLGEPNSIYKLVADFASNLYNSYSSSGDILTVLKFMLLKCLGNVKRVEDYMKEAISYANKYPEMNIMNIAANWINGGHNDIEALMTMAIFMPKEKRESIGAAVNFLEFIQSPITNSGKLLMAAAISRHDRRVMQQLLDIKASQLLTNAMRVANANAAEIIKGWYKGFENNRAIQLLLPLVMKAYEASTLAYTLSNTAGTTKDSYIAPTGQRGGSRMKRVVLAAPVGATGAAPADPTTGTAAPVAAPADTGNGISIAPPLGAGYTGIINAVLGATGKEKSQNIAAIRASMQELSTKSAALDNYFAGLKELSDQLKQQMQPVTPTEDVAGPSIEQPMQLAPEEIAAQGQQLREMADTAETLNTQILNELVSHLNSAKIYSKSLQTMMPSYQKSALATNKAKSNQIKAFKGMGLFAQYFGPTQRKINLLKIHLDAVVKQRTITETAAGLAGTMGKMTTFPLYQMEINAYRQILSLLLGEAVPNIQKAQEIEKGDTSASVWLGQIKSQVYALAKIMQAKINAKTMEMAMGDIGNGVGSAGLGFMAKGPMASVEDQMIRLSESPFNQKDEEKEKEPSKLFKDADKEIEDYWGDLLKGNPNYGKVLNNPKKYRHHTIKYRPKFIRTRKPV